VNFIASDRETDKDLFFGPLDGETFTRIEPTWNMSNIMAISVVFPSSSQARKNGWNKAIPQGFTDLYVGKNKTRITILNIKGGGND
jgi:hypothetical protein